MNLSFLIIIISVANVELVPGGLFLRFDSAPYSGECSIPEGNAEAESSNSISCSDCCSKVSLESECSCVYAENLKGLGKTCSHSQSLDTIVSGEIYCGNCTVEVEVVVNTVDIPTSLNGNVVSSVAGTGGVEDSGNYNFVDIIQGLEEITAIAMLEKAVEE